MGRFPGVLVLLLLGVLAKGETVNETTKNSPIIYYPTYYPVNRKYPDPSSRTIDLSVSAEVFVPPAPPPDRKYPARNPASI